MAVSIMTTSKESGWHMNSKSGPEAALAMCQLFYLKSGILVNAERPHGVEAFGEVLCFKLIPDGTDAITAEAIRIHTSS